jgi:hypothetical protein
MWNAVLCYMICCCTILYDVLLEREPAWPNRKLHPALLPSAPCVRRLLIAALHVPPARRCWYGPPGPSLPPCCSCWSSRTTCFQTTVASLAPAVALQRCCSLTAAIAAFNGLCNASLRMCHTFVVNCYSIPPSERYTPADPKSWERRCNCLGTIGRVLCCWGMRRSSSETRDANGKSQRLSSRLGNLFSMVRLPCCARLGCCTCCTGFHNTAGNVQRFL